MSMVFLKCAEHEIKKEFKLYHLDGYTRNSLIISASEYSATD